MIQESYPDEIETRTIDVYLRYETVNVDGFCLTVTVSTKYGLDIVRWIPRSVKNHNTIRSHQIRPQRT